MIYTYLLVATYEKATLKVNGISSSTRMRMLSDFIYKQEIDIILLQEATHIDFYRIRGLQRVRGLWKINRKLLEDTTVRMNRNLLEDTTVRMNRKLLEDTTVRMNRKLLEDTTVRMNRKLLEDTTE